MGIFSQNNKPGLGFATVEAAAGYGGVDAGAKIKLEGYQNDMALFTAIIESDFNAAKAEHEGALTESSVITEGTVANIFTKIKEFFKKLWEKLKGLIQSFMVKFVAVFVRDNKELVKKYHKTIVKQLANSKKQYEEMEYKMSEGYYKYLKGELKIDAIDPNAVVDIYDPVKFRNDSSDLTLIKEKFDENVIKTLNTKLKIDISELSELKKALTEEYIGDKEIYTGYNSSLNAVIEDELIKGTKTIKAAESEKKSADKKCKKLIQGAEKMQRESDKLEDVDKGIKEATIKGANASYYAATQIQTVLTDFATWKLSFLKGALKEIRSLYVKAVSRRDSVKEDAELLDAIIDEAVEYDVESMFEAEVEADLNDDDLSAELNSIDQISDDEDK